MTLLEKTTRARMVLERLHARYPEPETHLYHDSPWELLVATVLAAQCTDERVNKVTPALFSRWSGPAQLAEAAAEDLEEVIHSTGFYHNKAKNLIDAARRVMDAFGGEVPRTMAELVTLPGLARKTANVVLWGGFGINEGMAVDTHVKRISFRLGLTDSDNPVVVEKDLLPLFPAKEWGNVNHMMVWFGRHVCIARTPGCLRCEMLDICPQRGISGAYSTQEGTALLPATPKTRAAGKTRKKK